VFTLNIVGSGDTPNFLMHVTVHYTYDVASGELTAEGQQRQYRVHGLGALANASSGKLPHYLEPGQIDSAPFSLPRISEQAYSPKCLEGAFSDVREHRILGSAHLPGPIGRVAVANLALCDRLRTVVSNINSTHEGASLCSTTRCRV
jgi:hypothetical protein